jgi:4-amino-4-deoxy-L-arabinose transferase-like glycosyltransferase
MRPIPENRAPQSLAIVILWLFAGALMCSGLAGPDVSRTQEARVLETARELLGAPWRQWIIPRLNGRVRLEKPPLAYWMAAASFNALGVSEKSGRLPFALCNWLTLAVVYRAGRWLAGPMTGLLAAALLMSSYMFMSYGRLAETDGPASLCVTLAIYALWRSAGRANGEDGGSRSILWFHLAAAAAAIGFNAKPGAIAYPLLFVLLNAAVEREWKWAARFVLSGAPITAALLALPWYAAAIHLMGFKTFAKELNDVSSGRDHGGALWQYIPQFLLAVAPWSGLVVLAIASALAPVGACLARECHSERNEESASATRSARFFAALRMACRAIARGVRDMDAAARGLLLWIASISLPLDVIGNKQIHYLIPLPPAMLLAALMIARLPIRGPSKWFDAIGVATAIALLAMGIAVVVIAHQALGRVRGADVFYAAVLAALSGLTLAMWARRGRIALAMPILVLPILTPPLLGRWLPSLSPTDHRTLADDIKQKAGRGPYCFYGRNESFPLVFTLRAIVPKHDTPEELADALAREPRLVVITETKNNLRPPPLPARLTQVLEQCVEDQIARVYIGPARR